MADKALLLAEHHALHRTIAEALISKGTALSMLARTTESVALLRARVDLARAESDLPDLLRGMANLTVAAGISEGPEQAFPVAREALNIATTVGDLGQIVWQLGIVAFGLYLLAEPISPAIAEIDEVLARPLEPSDHVSLDPKRLVLAAPRGDDIDRGVAQYEALLASLDDPQFGADLLFVRMDQAVERGDYRTASDQAAALSRFRRDWNTMSRAVWQAPMAGNAARARELLDELETLPYAGRGDEAMRVLARAAVAAIDGRRDESLGLFHDANRRLREHAGRFFVAEMGLVMGCTLGAEVAERRSALEKSVAIFQRMGAVPLLAQARELLDGHLPDATAGLKEKVATPVS